MRKIRKNFKDEVVKMIIIPLSIGVIISLISIFFEQIKKTGRNEDKEYQSQVETLDQVSKNLIALQKFVNDQKESLKESEDLINKLKEEENKIRPIIEADRKTIESIFKLQAQGMVRKVWLERAVAFILGVLSSLVATIIFGFFKKKNTSRKIDNI